MRYIFFLFFLQGLLACQSIEIARDEMTVSFDKESRTVRSIEAQDDVLFFLLGDVEVYVSSYRHLSEQEMNSLQKRRRKGFLNLFKDDVSPYTGEKFLRSQCLRKVTDEFVDFFSGDRNIWFDCDLKGSEIAKRPATRIWKKCGSTLWEITIKSELSSSFVMSCSV